MAAPGTRFYEFGPFRLNVGERLLERGNDLVPLTPKVFDTLLLLIERSGHLFEKNDLMQSLWPDTFVEESSLTQNISLLRKALGDLGSEHQYIETIPKRGYRFIAQVREIDTTESEMILHERGTTEILVEEEVEIESRDVDFSKPRMPSAIPVFAHRKRVALIVAGVAMLSILALAIVFLSYRPQTKHGFGARSLAVLPFKTIGAEANQDLLGLGMADALILKLSALNQTIVLPTSSVLKYTNRDQDVGSIGRELGVDAVLDGTLQREGDQVRVTAQLIRTSDGKLLWSGKFDEHYGSSFALQDSASESLAKALMPQIEDAGKSRVVRRPTEDNEAYQSYLTGLYFWNRRSKENLTKAIPYFEQAISKDPKFALAHALLADCYYVAADGMMGILPSRDALTRADTETAKALELDNQLAEAHTVKAGLALLDNNAAAADREFRRALELNPNYPVAHLRYGYFLFSLQRLHEANDHMAQAQELDPVSPITNTARGFMLFMSRDYDSAVDAYRKAVELQPDMSAPRFNLGVAYVTKGMFQDALVEFEKLEETDALSAAKGKIWAYGQAGRIDDARRIILKLKQSKDQSGLTPFDYVYLYTAIGDKDRAFNWLEKVNLRGLAVARLKFEPQLDLLRGDVRYAQYLSRHQSELLPPALQSS